MRVRLVIVEVMLFVMGMGRYVLCLVLLALIGSLRADLGCRGRRFLLCPRGIG